MKVFDSNCKFLQVLFCPEGEPSAKVIGIHDVVTDQDDNVYVLARLQNASAVPPEFFSVCVCVCV